MITTATEKAVKRNIDRLNDIVENHKNREVKMLKTLNKLRTLNGKQTVSSFEEHKMLKSLGL